MNGQPVMVSPGTEEAKLARKTVGQMAPDELDSSMMLAVDFQEHPSLAEVIPVEYEQTGQWKPGTPEKTKQGLVWKPEEAQKPRLKEGDMVVLTQTQKMYVPGTTHVVELPEGTIIEVGRVDREWYAPKGSTRTQLYDRCCQLLKGNSRESAVLAFKKIS